MLSEECLKELFSFSGLAIKPAVWNKLFKKSIVDDLRFVEGVEISEDLLFSIEYLLSCENVAYVENTFYKNVQRKGSVTRSGAKATAIIRTVSIDEYIYRKIKSKYAKIADVVLAWTFQDNLGWYGELEKMEMKKEIFDMRKNILRRRYEVIFSKEIHWKQKILILFGIF